jgi:hypothetical protein
MSERPQITEWDNVRVIKAPATVAAGIVGRVGQVRGFTTPSATGVDVVGPHHDFAFGVVFDDDPDENVFWLPPRLLELVDHAPATELRVGGKVGVRQADGQWVVTDDPAGAPPSEASVPKRFWRRLLRK